jgi:hypothetical protein
MKDSIKDLINEKIKNYYIENGNYDFEKIKEHFEKENKIFMEDEVLRKRIDQSKNENFEFFKEKNKKN